MGRLIDANKMLDSIKLARLIEEYTAGELQNINNVKRWIENQPTVDAVPRESIDAMIAEIREYAYDEPEGYVCFCDREPDKIVSLEDVEDIIHKYTKKQGDNA